MSEHAARQDFGSPPGFAGVRDMARDVTGYWWVLLVSGIAWLVLSLVILQFDEASITTIGVLVGFLFLLAGGLNLTMATMEEVEHRWLWAIFGVLFGIAAVVCFISPEETFAGMADTLGFLFLLVGIWWMVRAFIEKPVNPAWWVGLIAGVLMTGMAFWTAGQFFAEKAYILLVFAGIWALMEGITNIVRAFAIREAHQELGADS